jgi:hypothetical protein
VLHIVSARGGQPPAPMKRLQPDPDEQPCMPLAGLHSKAALDERDSFHGALRPLRLPPRPHLHPGARCPMYLRCYKSLSYVVSTRTGSCISTCLDVTWPRGDAIRPYAICHMPYASCRVLAKRYLLASPYLLDASKNLHTKPHRRGHLAPQSPPELAAWLVLARHALPELL